MLRTSMPFRHGVNSHSDLCSLAFHKTRAHLKAEVMGTLLGLVVLVLDVLAIVDCIKTIKDTGKKVLWIVLILILPVVGLILYYLVGKKK